MKIRTYFRKFYKVLALNRDYVAYLGSTKMLYFVLLAFVTSVLNSLNYVALIPLASSVIDHGNPEGGLARFEVLNRFLPGMNEMPLVWLGGGIIFIFLIKMILNVLFAHIGGFFGESYLVDIRKRIIQTANVKAYEHGVQSSSKIYHLNNMVPKVGSFNWATFSLVSKIFSSLFLFFSLMIVSTKLAVFSMIFVLFWATILMPVLKFTRQSAELYTESLKKIQTFLIDEIEGREIIKVFKLGEKRFQSLTQLSKKMIMSGTYLGNMRTVVINLQEFLVVITGVIVLCYAKKYNLEVGYIIAYGYVFSKFLGTLNEASSYLNNALEVYPPSEEVLNFVGSVKLQPAPKVNSSAERLDSLEYRNLSFSWGDDSLLDIPEFLVQKGERLLIRGKNGEGKSTLLKLMAGLVKVSGTVKMNGKKEVSIADLEMVYDRISYIPQMGVLFDGSLVDNILLNSNKNISDIEVLCLKVGIDLEDYFPNWKQYQVTNSGKNLSGGEVQLLASLRALVRDFDVIFIDEFANHLSQKLMRQFDHYFSTLNDRIIIGVSHAPVSYYNKEYLLKDGKLTLVK